MMNMVKNFYFLFPAIILCIIGIWVRICFYIGLIVFILEIIVSFVEQWQIKLTVENNTNPKFAPFADAMTKDNWKDELNNVFNDAKKKLNDDTDDIEHTDL